MLKKKSEKSKPSNGTKAVSTKTGSGPSSSGKTMREKMMARKKELETRGNGGGLIYPKEGTLRMRIKSPGLTEELGIEVTQFYFGKELGGVISPATFDEPCPIMAMYRELKESDDDDDKEVAKLLVPRKKYVVGGVFYKDEKGKEVDPDRINKGVLIARGIYQDIIDLFLDEDEWGDMTDAKEGYDIKINRSGSGMTDTEYSVSPCQKKPLAKEYQGTIDLKKIVKSQIPSYEALEEKLQKFLNISSDDEDERPSKKSSKPMKKKAKGKFKRDI